MKVQGPDHGSKYRQITIYNNSVKNTFSAKWYSLLLSSELYYICLNLSYIWFTFEVIIDFSMFPKSQSLRWSTLFPLVLLVFIFLVQIAKDTREKLKKSLAKNKRTYEVWNGSEFITKYSENICIGDILSLKAKQVSPAGLLLIASSSENNEVCISMQGKESSARLVLKKTVNLDFYDKTDMQEFSQRVEYIQVALPKNPSENILGKIKISGNPTEFQLLVQNFLPADLVVANCDWVLGVVLYVGAESKVSLNKTGKKIILSKLKRTLNFIVFFNFLVIVVLVLINCLIGLYMGRLGFWDKDLGIAVVILYCDLIPISLFLSIAILNEIQAFLIHKRNPNVAITNCKVLEDLGRTEYILTEKKGILTSPTLEIFTCVIQDSFYVKNDQKKHPLFSRKSPNSILYKFSDLKEELANNFTKEQLYLILGCLLCNKKISENKDLCENPDDNTLLDFSNQLGVRITHENKAYQIYLNTQILEFKIICSNISQASISWILIKNQREKEGILLVKSESESIFQIFPDEQMVLLNNLYKNKALVGVRKIIFGYKILTKIEVNDFKLDMKQAENFPINKQNRIDVIFSQHWKTIFYLGIIGIENEVIPGVNECIEILNETKIKIWVTTEDSEEGAIFTGIRTGMLTTETPIVRLENLKTPLEGLKTMERAIQNQIFLHEAAEPVNFNPYNMNSRRNSIPQENPINQTTQNIMQALGFSKNTQSWRKKIDLKLINYALTIDSVSLNSALFSRKSRQSLVILLFAAKTVFFSGILPKQKSKLIKFLQRNFSFKPTIAALITEENNGLIVSNSDVVISLSQSLTENKEYSDISIRNFSELKNLLMVEGHNCYYRNQKLVGLNLFKAYCLTAVLFLYQFESEFSGVSLVSYDVLVVFKLLFSIVPIVLVGIFDGIHSKEEIMENPAVYSDGYMSAVIFKMDVILWAGQGLVAGLVIYVLVIYGIGNIVNSHGFTEDFEIKGVVTLILLVLALLTKIFVLLQNKIRALFTITASLVLLLIVLFVISSNNLGYTVDTNSFTNQTSTWFIICIFPFIAYIILTPYNDILKKESHKKTRLSQYQSDLSSVFCDSENLKIKPEESSFNIRNNLTFESETKEMQFRKIILRLHKSPFKVFTIVSTVVHIINAIMYYNIDATLINLGDASIVVIVIQFGFVLASFWKKTNWMILLNLYYVCVLIYSFSELSIDTVSLVLRYPIFLFFFGGIVSISWKFAIIQMSAIFLQCIIAYFIEYARKSNENTSYIVVHWTILMCGVFFLCNFVSYFREFNMRNDFALILTNREKMQEIADVLNYTLPKFVIPKLKKGCHYIMKNNGPVTVIYCEISNIDEIVCMYSPSELINFLNDLFSKIDEICELFGITKIETIGKTYIACAGLRDSESTLEKTLISVSHARRGVEFGLAILQKTEKTKLKNGNFLKLKIGASSGNVLGGVFGYFKPNFVLLGETVNNSYRMASFASENSMLISQNTYEMVTDSNGLSFEDQIFCMKGKGEFNVKIVKFANRDQFIPFQINSNVADPVLDLDFLDSGEMPDQENDQFLINLSDSFEETLLRRISTNLFYTIVTNFWEKNENEQLFRLYLAKSNKKLQKYGMMAIIVYNGGLIILELLEISNKGNSLNLLRLLALIVEEIEILLILIFQKRIGRLVNYTWVISLIYLINYFIFCISFIQNREPLTIEYLHFILLFIQLNFFTVQRFSKSIYSNIIAIVLWLSFEEFFFVRFSYTAMFIILVLLKNYIYEKRELINFMLRAEMHDAITRAEPLLLQVMPIHILKAFEVEKRVSEENDQVTLIYADIVGYNAREYTVRPDYMYKILSKLFKKFDKMCVEYNVYKVQIIGNCYVAQGNLAEISRNSIEEAMNVMKFAKSLQRALQEINQKFRCDLGIRIGIHTGVVVGGVTGTNVLKYDIYGQDVLIASKMLSGGPDKITVSEKTKNFLEEYYGNTFRFNLILNLRIYEIDRAVNIFEAIY